MAYMGRAAVAGRYDSRAFVGFVLASKSEPDRKLDIDKERNRVWVAPGGDVTAKLKARNFTAIDNLYACLIGFYDSKKRPAAVAFNGRMSNRAEAMVAAGYGVQKSMRGILHVFAPNPGDPRIGVIAYLEEGAESHKFCWGVHDMASQGLPYFSVSTAETDDNQASYTALASPDQSHMLELEKGMSLDELSQFLFERILGNPPEFGCGAAVCLIDGNEFRFGVHNAK
jgi:hypothetical protein